MTAGLPTFSPESRTLDALLICGAPGSGKSTLAEGLRAREALRHGAVIEVDQLRGMVVAVDWTDRAIHAAALEMAIDGAIRLVVAGVRPVLVVDTFAWSTLAGAQARLDAAELRHATLTLWVRGRELGRRLSARRRGYRDLAGALQLNTEIVADLRPGELLLDASDLEPGAVEQRALALIGGMLDASERLERHGVPTR